jgi:hypothetical protein
MTNKGMAAINEALTIVEKVPTTFSESDQSVPVTTIMILKFILQITQHAQDNKAAICTMMNAGKPSHVPSMTDEQILSMYVSGVCGSFKDIVSKIEKMPPHYPIEQVIKLLSEQLASFEVDVAKHGLGPL